MRTGPSLNHGRKFIPVILLNERIAVFGGSSQDEGNPVFIPEIFDPENEGQGWTDLTAAMIQYLDYIMVLHCSSLMDAFGQQAALLISVNLNCVQEIYQPDYFSASITRPTISRNVTLSGGYNNNTYS